MRPPRVPDQPRASARERQLQRLLVERYGLDAELGRALESRFVPCTFARGESVVRAGARDERLYFVQSGVLRVFFTSADGKQHNKAFVGDGMFFVALSAHLQAEPVRFDVEALCATEALHMPYPEFERLREREPALAGLWRRYMEAHFVRHEAREYALQCLDARGRYLWFSRQHPELSARVPLYHVASYLGLTNVTLSRVRRSLARARS